MRTTITFSFLLLLMMPISARAAVVINEFAWMGDLVSANHEWLELYNNGDSTVSLDGWLFKDGLNLEIPLSGSIGALDYAVLERTSEESAPGTALLIYTGALVNTGATLTLYSAGGEIVDQVAGGENWVGVGGDNVTKETAQYTSSGWVTDEATPGKVNKTGRDETEVVENSTPTQTPTNNSNSSVNVTRAKSSSNNSETVRLVTLDTELKLKLDFQSLAYVNQPINFVVEGSGIGENIINSLNYVWNFGDTNIATGKKTTHAYAYPGTYVVTLRANYARHNQVVRQEITVLPVTFSMTKNKAGDVQIHNDAPYDVELSGFVVRGAKDFVFPPDTIIIPRGTITVKASKLGILNKSQVVALYDQEKILVASNVGLPTLPKSTIETLAVAKISHSQNPNTNIAEINSTSNNELESIGTAFNFARQISSDSEKTELVETVDQKSANLLATPKALASDEVVTRMNTNMTPSTKNSWAYLALIGLLFLGFVGLLLRPNKPTEE